MLEIERNETESGSRKDWTCSVGMCGCGCVGGCVGGCRCAGVREGERERERERERQRQRETETEVRAGEVETG